MRTTEALANAFGPEFEKWIGEFSLEKKLLTDLADLNSPRFLSRSIVPHIQKLSSLFNRTDQDQKTGLPPYWKESSNPQHLRLAYFLYFMPCNLFRMASVWNELARLGFQWKNPHLKAIEFGAGPASGACGIAAGEFHTPVGLPQSAYWALIEQDQAVLSLGNDWAKTYFSHLQFNQWDLRPFHRKLEIEKGLLPRNAPKFNLWLMSYYLNESLLSAEELAQSLVKSWATHLEEEGVVIMIEPALKQQSRRILELRRELLKLREEKGYDWLQILLPCLGHQACGALKDAEDWCHEEATWWRPPYMRRIDKLAGLDRKTLPFSYLVIAKSRRTREEILPGLGRTSIQERYRLVSPAHPEGKEQEFFLCGQEGKRRARYRAQGESDPAHALERGDILMGAQLRGDTHASRVTVIKEKI